MPAAVILPPPLHIKLGLVKNFIKSMVTKNKNEKKGRDFSETMDSLSMVFPKLSDSKLNEGKNIKIILQLSIFVIKNDKFFFV